MASHGFESRYARRLVMRRLLMVAVVGGFCAPPPVEARDRPGTPNQEALSVRGYTYHDYKPMLCGALHNTASEAVTFESEITRNGAPLGYDRKTPIPGAHK